MPKSQGVAVHILRLFAAFCTSYWTAASSVPVSERQGAMVHSVWLSAVTQPQLATNSIMQRPSYWPTANSIIMLRPYHLLEWPLFFYTNNMSSVNSPPSPVASLRKFLIAFNIKWELERGDRRGDSTKILGLKFPVR